MEPPSKFGGSEKTNSTRWLAGSEASVLRLKVTSAVKPRPGMLMRPARQVRFCHSPRPPSAETRKQSPPQRWGMIGQHALRRGRSCCQRQQLCSQAGLRAARPVWPLPAQQQLVHRWQVKRHCPPEPEVPYLAHSAGQQTGCPQCRLVRLNRYPSRCQSGIRRWVKLLRFPGFAAGGVCVAGVAAVCVAGCCGFAAGVPPEAGCCAGCEACCVAGAGLSAPPINPLSASRLSQMA